MADLGSTKSLSQTILYLRPTTRDAVEVLDLKDNQAFVEAVAASGATDKPLEEALAEPSEDFFSNYLHPFDEPSHANGRASRESSPGQYPISPRVIRLGFYSVKLPSLRGFEFGSKDESQVKILNVTEPDDKAYFRIHYNFESGALLITAMAQIRVGNAYLKKNESLLIMNGMSIHCGGTFEFTVEFPDLSDCAEAHECYYHDYTTRLGVPNAPYLMTPQAEYPLIGAEHRSVATMGEGGYGVVHKVLNIKNGRFFALKVLKNHWNTTEERSMKEVQVMSSLVHENIIKYERAFKISTGEICIVMELAVNDLDTHLRARQKGGSKCCLSLQCVQSIGQQSLSALEYLHASGVMHRDLKPVNMLVTKWDAKTDIPTIKLADFGLAGTGIFQATFCGTTGYRAPEIESAQIIRQEISEGRLLDVPEVLLAYTEFVDIWALGKILYEFLQLVQPRVKLRGGLSFAVNKEPADRLVGRMMEYYAANRPSAADCLKDPWMAIHDGAASLAGKKRDRSPTSAAWSPASNFGKSSRR